ncbi:MAG: hypothetical protein K5799_09270 [Erythrobacter sp.]|nr:hypothetical protein [Erythrobacter sp.]
MILIRTQHVDRRLHAFSQELAGWSGMAVAFVVDERKGAVAIPGGAAKVSLTETACRDLGLYCPPDFAWRCGDYGLYLARQAFPDRERFWLIESDVRIAGAAPGRFFSVFEHDAADLLSSYMEPATPDWFWYRAAANRDLGVHKCFFPVCRFSAAAIDRMLTVRQLHGKSWARRHFWPNDEAFVATTLIGENWAHADLNAVGETVYDPAEFHFESVFDGDSDLPTDGPPRLFHPVLFSPALEAKRARLASRDGQQGRFGQLIEKFDRRLGISALAFRVNRSRPWAS